MVEVVDTWYGIDAQTVRVDRTARVARSGSAAGVRIEIRAQTTATGTSGLDDWAFFIPGALYKKNDIDHDGVEDYLGTYTQDYRDDRLASLAVLAYPALRSGD